MDVEPLFATVGEAAKALNISEKSMRKMLDGGEVEFARFGRSIRIPWRWIRGIASENSQNLIGSRVIKQRTVRT